MYFRNVTRSELSLRHWSRQRPEYCYFWDLPEREKTLAGSDRSLRWTRPEFHHLQTSPPLSARRLFPFNILFPLIVKRIPSKILNKENSLQFFYQDLHCLARRFGGRINVESILIGKEILTKAFDSSAIDVSCNDFYGFHLRPLHTPISVRRSADSYTIESQNLSLTLAIAFPSPFPSPPRGEGGGEVFTANSFS